MNFIGVFLLFGASLLIAVCQGQCIRIRSGTGGQSPGGQSCSTCGTSVEDLTTLLAIIRALEEKETPKSGINNAEEIIMQLVNALVYTATQNSGCQCPGSNVGGGSNGGSAGNNGGANMGGNGGVGGIGSMGGTGNNGGMGGSGTNGGMSGNGANGGMGGTGTNGGAGSTGNNGILGGLSGNGGNSGSGTGTGTGSGNGVGNGGTGGSDLEYPDNGLISIDLLHPGNSDYEHLVRLGLAGQRVLDLGLGHDDGLVGSLLNKVL